MATATPRLASLDAVRVVGIVAIVIGHTTSNPTIYRLTFSWHVPVFFFLSGWLWRPGRGLFQEVRTRARTLLVPYLAWAIILGVAVLYRFGGSVSELAKNIVLGGNYLHRPFTAFWFLTALFVICVVRRVLDRLPLPVVTVIAMALWLASYPISTDLARVPESAGMALASLIFLVAGEWARRLHARLPAPGWIGAALVIVALLVVKTTDVRVLNLKVGQMGTPVAAYLVAVAISFGLVLVAIEVVPRASVRLQHGITVLSLTGLTVILTHTAILWAVDAPTDHRYAEVLAVLSLPWLLALALRRTPLSPVLVGAPYVRWRARAEPSPSRGREGRS